MVAEVINGKQVAASVILRVKALSADLETQKGLKTGLAVVIVGDDPASHAYVLSKSKMAKECGFTSVQHTLPVETTQEELAALVQTLIADERLHGILVQLPLPSHLNSDLIIQSILPEKDVDGLHVINAGKLATGDLDGGLVSCTPAGAMVFVQRIHGEDLSGLNAVVIGRSNLFGKPMAQLLVAANATATITHSSTRDLPTVCRAADILVAAVGRPEMVKSGCVKSGATVIDVGINRIPAPERGDGKSRMVGDVRREAYRKDAWSEPSLLLKLGQRGERKSLQDGSPDCASSPRRQEVEDFVSRARLPWDDHSNPRDLRAAATRERAADAIEEVVLREGPDTVGCLVLEPVTAGGGVILPPEGYWDRVKEICRKYNILLHIDEVVCGLGRTGTWFGYQHYGIQPDFVTMAKGVASGYAAISCTVTTESVFEMFKDAPEDTMSFFRDISTFGGCTVGTVAALENMRIIEDEGLLENTVAMGARCLANLENLMHKHSVIGDVRGKGLFLGAELVSDRATKEPLNEKLVQAVVAKCMSEGVIIGATNRSLHGLNNTLCLSPALIASADDIDRITSTIDYALTTTLS